MGRAIPPRTGWGPLKVHQCQIWTDLLAAGLAMEKLDRQPLDVLLTPRRQVHPEQRYRLLGQRTKAAPVNLAEVTLASF